MKRHTHTQRFMKLFIVIAAIAAMSVTVSIAAPRYDRETPQTYEDLFKQALETSPTYRSTWEEQILAKYTLYRAYGDFLPGITLSSRYSVNKNYSPTSTTSGSSGYGVSLSLPIWEGGARYYTLDNARLAVKASPIILTQSQQQLSYNLRLAINTSIASSELVRAARSAIALRKELLRLAETKYALGATTEIDVLSTRIQVGTAENTLLQAIQDSTIYREKINQIIGVALTSRYPLAEPQEESISNTGVDSLVNRALSSSPTSILAKLNYMNSLNNKKISDATWWPTLSLSAGYDYSETGANSKDWTIAPEGKSSSVGISLNYPLFTGFQRAETRERSKVELKQSKWTQNKTYEDLEQSVRENHSKYVRAKAQIVIAEANLDLAKRQRDMEQERYRVGSSTLLNVQNAQTAELDSEIELVKRKLEARTAKALLEYSVGSSLTR
ncbi:MAG: TolC family protein [bacterium]|nr:TolC family protein [bacterium]